MGCSKIMLIFYMEQVEIYHLFVELPSGNLIKTLGLCRQRESTEEIGCTQKWQFPFCFDDIFLCLEWGAYSSPPSQVLVRL